jgi:DNA helicase-2/ATP-dependent DNA helicase PcrA
MARRRTRDGSPEDPGAAAQDQPAAGEDAAVAPAPLAVDALNDPQKVAVAHADGPLLVFAGAGSGKTRVITYRIAHLVSCCDVAPYRILAVTFTNKAAGEMRTRLMTLLGRDLARSLWLGTFHAVCVRLIRRYHENVGLGDNFVIYDESDQKSLMTRVLKELGIDERRYPPNKILARIQREKQEARGPDEFKIENYVDEVAKRCFEVYQRRLHDANAADFEDLLLHVLRLVENQQSEAAAHLRARFSHVLVDEFQDTNLVQYRLVRGLAATRNICVVGDDDQSIYRWRGADVRNIRGFSRDFPDATVVKLEQNYRSSANIVGAALGVIRVASDRAPKELWTANDQGEPVLVVQAANERDEAAYVAREIARSVARGTSPRDIAVFYRVHAQSRVLEEALRVANIPYQIVGGLKFFDRAEVKDLLAYLRVIVNPKSDVDLLRIINRPARKLGSRSVERVVALAQLAGTSVFEALATAASDAALGKAAQKSLRDFYAMLASFVPAARSAPPLEIASEVLQASGYQRWLKDQDSVEADSRLENLQELLGSIAEYEEERAQAGEPATLADYLTRVSLLADADTMAEVPRVPMMTVHAAKGLEFDVVLLCGLEDGLFPLRGREPGERDELEEERRLAYVAITRARKSLHVVHTLTRMIYGQTRYNQPSLFLADVPPRHQHRVATDAMLDLGRRYTREPAMPSWRSVIRGDRDAAPRLPAVRAPGERYVERDDDAYHPGFDAPGTELEGVELRRGCRVRHTKFGLGTVRDIAPGQEPSLTVLFDDWGQKSIKLTSVTRKFLSPA